MIEIRHDVARRLETLLRDLRPNILERWTESALKKSARFHFSSPLPGAVYTKLIEEFVHSLCRALGETDREAAEAFWPDCVQTGPLGQHTHDEVVHLCATACRSVTETIDHATEGAEDGPSVRIALQRVLAEIREALTAVVPRPVPDKVTQSQPAPELAALVAAAENLQHGLVWSDLYGRDVRRSRRLEALQRMLLESRGLNPAESAASVLRRLYDELPCRVCLLVRFMGREHGARFESVWPVEALERELGEAIQLDGEALKRVQSVLDGGSLSIEHAADGLEAEVARFGARAMAVLSVPRGKEAAAWLVIGTDEAEALAQDDVEFARTTAVVLGMLLDNATLSIQLGAAVRRFQNLVHAAPEPILVLDPAGVVLDLSEAAADALGAARSELVGTHLGKTGFLGDRDTSKPLPASIEPAGCVLTARRADGMTFRAACSTAKLDDGSIIFAFYDVSRFERPAEALSEEIMRSAPVGMAVVDAAGRVIQANEGFARILRSGGTAEAMTGVNLVMGANAPLAPLAAPFKKALGKKSFATFPFKRAASAGAGEVWLTARGTPLGDKDTAKKRMLLVLDEVTAQVRRRKQLDGREKIAAARALVTTLARYLSRRLEPVIGHARSLQQSRIGIADMARVNAIERAAREAKGAIERLLGVSKQKTRRPNDPA